MLSKVKARDVMVDTVVTVQPEMSLDKAWSLLFENRVSGAPVVTSDGEIVGVLSQTDLVREAFSEGFENFPKDSFYFGTPFYDYDTGLVENVSNRLSEMTVEEVMTREPICADVDDDVSLIAGRMRQNHIHRVIITSGRNLAGIISSLDLLKLLEAQ